MKNFIIDLITEFRCDASATAKILGILIIILAFILIASACSPVFTAFDSACGY